MAEKGPPKFRRAKPIELPVKWLGPGLHPRPAVLVQGWDGRFLPHTMRYTEAVKYVYSYRGTSYHMVYDAVESKKPLNPAHLIDVLTVDEFEKMPPAFQFKADYKSTSKYQAWDIAKQIDRTIGIRRKQLQVVMELDTSKGRRRVEFWTKVKSPKERSYQIFTQMNQSLAKEQLFTYDRVRGKKLKERYGTKARIRSVRINQVL